MQLHYFAAAATPSATPKAPKTRDAAAAASAAEHC